MAMIISINFEKTDLRDIQISLADKQKKLAIDFNFRHSNHSFKRCSQRGIDKDKISIAITHGECVYKQGLIYFILGEHNIPGSLQKDNSRLKNIVVLVSGKTNEIITSGCQATLTNFNNQEPLPSLCWE